MKTIIVWLIVTAGSGNQAVSWSNVQFATEGACLAVVAQLAGLGTTPRCVEAEIIVRSTSHAAAPLETPRTVQ